MEIISVKNNSSIKIINLEKNGCIFTSQQTLIVSISYKRDIIASETLNGYTVSNRSVF